LFEWHYLRVYISIIVGTLILIVLQNLFSLPIYIGLILAGLISLIVLFINRSVLNIEQIFPELLRVEILRILFGTRRSKKQLAE
jgi:Mn2+/Fe2+ NRAMP family transporter